MVLVDGDVTSDVVDFYMTWIACMLREIELMTFSRVHLYMLYRLATKITDATVLKFSTTGYKYGLSSTSS